MKVLERKEFLQLNKKPILFQKFRPMVLDSLQIKYNTINDIDFYYEDLLGMDIKTNDCEPNDSGELFELWEQVVKGKEKFERNYYNSYRDGLFDEDELYLVYEDEDVEKLIRYLQFILNAKSYKDIE